MMPVAVWVVLSGLDDLFITLVSLIPRRFPFPSDLRLARTPERRIAIFVPLWREHDVISRMLARNLAAIRYRNYDVFVGVYPNDGPTIRAVTEQAAVHRRIHIATVPHDGPTSKADCLNAIYRRMREYESRHHVRFRIVVTHDAEDVAHGDSLRLINFFSRRYAMVQIPVLPLDTAPREFPHGLYCDEFAEYQRKDIPVRQALGGFLPANGVGTGFDRDVLEQLAATRSGKPFDPACLTEDYETGYRIHALGYPQIFVPLQCDAEDPVATREFFPKTFWKSVSQRTRWVTGIALQGWQHHGWPWRQAYWFWRDRKGLVGNLLCPLSNLLFLYGLIGWATGSALTEHLPRWLVALSELACGITLVQAAVRAHSAFLIYGRWFAMLVPFRMLYGNIVNFMATAIALWEFFEARRGGKTLSWRKTDHTYPAPAPAFATGFRAAHFER